ncbi:PLP-dependent aminotransferase family protein [Phyllobacterium myrsinacearum]|uniref:GntR family transcriptional regulator n=1 Tax=Phyllobacterium myrsinacearum TaxID=28101 RepID=A0A2S9JQX2_9HYPH|nr:PLP-dependent aminotransferase family protein [Phyllobacterium myrsinacearum]PRD55581.1 GntR family transcriptional regulator [Phyllobacterium myrsinacearum]PWV91936.1 GntR family transcriptional regulator [Phyllobacterium myrsinacearum]RZS77226.1 GntR family transcriptional regulator [Phyllobacterium myrsinacearum]RZV06003.1 GntR family transcriptional regulator [Phyllobacterium myrsinacearum]
MAHSAVSKTIFFLDPASRVGLQVQIRETIVSAVLAGRIQPGAQLPSTRKLADYLNISRITVTLAYQELASQGYVETARRSAYRISNNPPIGLLATEAMPAVNNAIDWPAKIRTSFVVAKQMSKPLDWRRYPYPFLYGQMDPSLFDLNAWRDCARRALAREDFELMAGDFAAADDVQLVNYICSRTLPSRGIRANTDEILVTVGAQNALWIVTRLLLRQGTHAVCESPCHPDMSASLLLSGARVTAIGVDKEGLPPINIPADVDAVFVTPSHHSPTGATMPIERRARLLEAANEQDFIIIEDDYEFEMSFLAPPSPALKAFDRKGRVLYIGSFSKSLFPGLRLGYLVAPAPFIREARALRALMLRHPPGHLQRTAAYFLAFGHHDAALHRMRDEYHKRHIIMAKALQREGFTIAGSSAFGGTSFWVEGPEGLDADLLMAELRQDGVLIESGSPFFPDANGPCSFFRMGYSSIPRSNIDEGVARTRARIETLLSWPTPKK